MDTRLLNRFVAVVELGSLNRAAQKLNLSQPALSKSIQALEETLGVDLMKRGPRGASVTAFGQSVYTYAKLIGAEMRKMEEEIGALRALTPWQIATIERSASLLPLHVPTIELAGGSVRCMLAGIHLKARPAMQAMQAR